MPDSNATEAVAPGSLGAVHRYRSVAQQLVGLLAVAAGKANAGRDREALARRGLQPEGVAERGYQALDDRLDAAAEGRALEHDGELVATEAPQRSVLADHALEPRADRTQQLIADVVPERFVDRFEVVEIDEQHTDRRRRATRSRERLLDAIDDQRAVGQAGERVVRGEKRELLLAACELLVGDVALGLKGLRHPHDRHVEAALQHAERVGERLV